MVIPQANGLPLTRFPEITLLYVGPASSLIRIPPELFWLTLFATMEWSAPVKLIPSPQSWFSPVWSAAGNPGHVEPELLTFKPLLLESTWLLQIVTFDA